MKANIPASKNWASCRNNTPARGFFFFPCFRDALYALLTHYFCPCHILVPFVLPFCSCAFLAACAAVCCHTLCPAPGPRWLFSRYTPAPYITLVCNFSCIISAKCFIRPVRSWHFLQDCPLCPAFCPRFRLFCPPIYPPGW
jgi:hypothetical protein